MYDDEYYEPDPSDFEPDPPRQKGPLSSFPTLEFFFPSMIFFVLFVAAGYVFWQHPYGDKLWVSGKSVFQNHEYWRLVTALFVHGDAMHLLSNMPFFLVFGWLLRGYFGRLVFPLAALVTGVGSNAVTVYFYKPETRLVGASGMVYGMMAMWLIYYVRYDSDHPVPVRIFRAVGFALVMLFPSTFQQTTSYTAHGAGFFIGLICAIVLSPFVSVTSFASEENTHLDEYTGFHDHHGPLH